MDSARARKQWRCNTFVVAGLVGLLLMAGSASAQWLKIPLPGTPRKAYAWLDGRDAIQLSEIQINVPIDAAKFGRPAPLK